MRIADLSEAEQAVADALPHGREVDLTGESVRADVLAGLLLAADPAPRARLRLVGASVTGVLNLAFAELGFPVSFNRCAFDEPPDLYQARTRFLSFTCSRLPGLVASNLQVEGNLRLNGCHSTGEVRMPGARISGNLVLNGATLDHRAGVALNAEHLDLTGTLRAENGFTSAGELVLTAARVGGAISMDGARLSAPGRSAFEASNAIVQVGLFARGIEAEGEICVRFARVSGPLTLRGARVRNPGGIAVRAGGLTAEGGLFLALSELDGPVRLDGATISRALDLDGATLRNPGGTALSADAITVDGALHAAEGMSAEGEIDLVNASITGPAHFEGARLDNPGGNALSANGITVGKVLNLCDGFTAHGRIRLTNAHVGSCLCLNDATIAAPGEVAVKCWRLETRELAMRTARPVEGTVDLRHARVGVLRDAPDSWPESMLTDGMTYDVMEPLLPAARRLEWLRRDAGGYLPSAYEQLAAMYRRLGNEADARDTLLAGHRQRRTALPWYGRVWGHLQDATVGYGYRPLRAASWLLALLAVGTVVFALAPPPALKAGEAPPFNAFMYSLDLLLPIIDFGQEKAFNPAGGPLWLSYTLIVAGWVLATTIATGLTRSLRRA